ncbi:MAG: HEPN domain-containing protein [Dehalococcoidia bacterium]|nr:HEPN domain-containing protein [Dehalococcoidia bacterium]
MEVCFLVGEWESCISRGYYAAYHMVAAVIEAKKGFTRPSWEHERLLQDFREHFTSIGYMFSDQDGDDLANLMGLRFEVDYRDVEYNVRTIERAMERTRRLYSRIKEVLDAENT